MGGAFLGLQSTHPKCGNLRARSTPSEARACPSGRSSTACAHTATPAGPSSGGTSGCDSDLDFVMALTRRGKSSTRPPSLGSCSSCRMDGCTPVANGLERKTPSPAKTRWRRDQAGLARSAERRRSWKATGHGRAAGAEGGAGTTLSTGAQPGSTTTSVPGTSLPAGGGTTSSTSNSRGCPPTQHTRGWPSQTTPACCSSNPSACPACRPKAS